MAITLEQARAAKVKLLEQVRGVPEVAGVGITRVNEDYAVKLNLIKASSVALPSDVDGVPVRVEVVGASRRF